MANENINLNQLLNSISEPLATKELKVAMSKTERDDMADQIKNAVLDQVNQQPTYIKDVETLNRLYPPENYDSSNPEYQRLYLIKEGQDVGYLYYFDSIDNLWAKGTPYEDSKAIKELQANKRDNATIYSNKDTEFANAMAEVVTLKDFYNYFYDKRKSTTDSWQLELTNYSNVVTALEIPVANNSALLINRVGTEAGGYFLDLYLTNNGQSILYRNTIGGWLSGCEIGEWQNLKLSNKISTTAEANTMVMRHNDGSVHGKNNDEPLNDELISAKYLTQALSEKLDIRVDVISSGVTQPDANFILANYKDYEGSLIQFYKNSGGPTELISYGFVMCSLDGNQKSLIEIDRDGVITKWTEQTNYRVSAEQERGVNYTPVDNHTVKLIPAQMRNAKGLRIWIEFPYQQNYLCQYVEMRFSNKTTTNIYIGIPLPEPNAFASPMAVQYFRRSQEVIVPTNINPNGRITKEEGLLEIVRADKQPVSMDIVIKDIKAIF